MKGPGMSIFRTMGCLVLAAAACANGLFAFPTVQAVEDADEATRPAVLTDTRFWQDRRVVQVRGWVLDKTDNDGIMRKRYWTLGDAAVAKVTEILDGGEVICEFPGYDKGWQEHGINEQDRRRTKPQIYYDAYGDRWNVETYSYTEQGIPVNRSDHGILISDDSEEKVRKVRFPVNCIGLCRPRVGDRILRGPDWHAGRADGGPQPTGELPPSVRDQFWGTVIEPRDADGYMKVEWEQTGRKASYRFDCRRFYDIVSMPDDDSSP